MLSSEEKNDRPPLNSARGFIAILCEIFSDGYGDRFFLLRLYLGLRERIAQDQNIILVCDSEANCNFFKENLPQPNTIILKFDNFLSEFDSGLLGTCYGVIQGPAFKMAMSANTKKIDVKLDGAIPWVLLPEYNFLEHSRDERLREFNENYFSGKLGRNRVLLGTGFGSWANETKRLGVFIPNINSSEQNTFCIDSSLSTLFTKAGLNFTDNPYFSIAYLNNFECQKELALDEKRLKRMMLPSTNGFYSSTDLFLGNFLHSLPEQVPENVYLTLVSPYPPYSKNAVEHGVTYFNNKFSSIVLYELYDRNGRITESTTEIMNQNHTESNSCTLRIFLTNKVSHSTWLSLLKVSSGSIVGATGDQSFIEALKEFDGFISYELRKHKVKFYTNFINALLEKITEQYKIEGSCLSYQETQKINKFFIRLGDGYLPSDTDFSTDRLYNDVEFKAIYLKAKKALLAQYNLDENLNRVLPFFFPHLKLSVNSVSYQSKLETTAVEDRVSELPASIQLTEFNESDLFNQLQEKISSCAIVLKDQDRIEIKSIKTLIRFIKNLLNDDDGRLSTIKGEGGQLDTLIVPLENNHKLCQQLASALSNQALTSFIRNLTKSLEEKMHLFEVKKNMYIEMYSDLVKYERDKVASFIVSMNEIRNTLMYELLYETQSKAEKNAMFNTIFYTKIKKEKEPLDRALELLDEAVQQIIDPEQHELDDLPDLEEIPRDPQQRP